MSKPIALLCSDIHLSERAPSARSEEPDWFAAMARPLKWLGDRAEALDVPIIGAGDIFDKWKVSPELINFAFVHLPPMYSVAGQHDLPYHAYEDIKKSAYWTLVEGGILTNLEPCVPLRLSDALALVGHPWGFPPAEAPVVDSAVILAVVHAYIWKKGSGYHEAPEDAKVGAFKKGLEGYTNAVFGDNHLPFTARAGDCRVINTGGFYRRTTDQKDHRPTVGILYDDGTIKVEHVPTEEDILVVGEEDILPAADLDHIRDFVGSLANITTDKAMDFRKVVKQYAKKADISPETYNTILEALDGHELTIIQGN